MEQGEVKEEAEEESTNEDTQPQYVQEQEQEQQPEQYSVDYEENNAQNSPQQQQNPEDIVTHNIFVGDLKSDVVEQNLFDAFKACGEIHSVHIFRDPHTQEQKGFGFVHFMTREAQQKALSDEFKNVIIKVN